MAKRLADKFRLRESGASPCASPSASDNSWSAMLYDTASNEYCFSKSTVPHRPAWAAATASAAVDLLPCSARGTQGGCGFAVAALPRSEAHTIEATTTWSPSPRWRSWPAATVPAVSNAELILEFLLHSYKVVWIFFTKNYKLRIMKEYGE